MEALKACRAAALAWAACLILVWGLASPMAPLEKTLSDLLVWRTAPAAPDLVLIDIDEASLAVMGPWPWSRPLLGELAEKLGQAGVKRQAWDLLLAEPRNGDAALQQRLGLPSMTVGVVPVIDPAVEAPPQTGSLGRPLPGLTNVCGPDTPFAESHGHIGLAETLDTGAVNLGHLTPVIDDDGRLRKIPAIICHQGRAIPTLALAGLLGEMGDKLQLERGAWPWSAPWRLVNDQIRIPLDERGNILLDYRTPLADFPTLPAYRALEGSAPPDLLKDKNILLGASALGLGDRVATRLSPTTPGLAVHAELYSRLRDGSFATPLRQAWLLSLGLVALISLVWVVRPQGARIGLPIAAALSFAGAAQLINQGLQIALLPILLWHALFAVSLLALRLAQEKQARRQHQRRLASIIPPALLEQLDPEAPQDIVAARRRTFGVVHAHLRNLPLFANRAEPEQVLAVFHALNRLAQQIASTHGAQLYPSEMQEFLLMWPNHQPQQDTSRMLLAARELHQGVTRLLSNLESATGLALEIAIHADEALDGFIGSRDRRRPILYGHLRQVSQAMLALSAELASPILASDAALPGRAEEYALRDLGVFKLEDIRRPYTLYACTQTLDPLPGCDT